MSDTPVSNGGRIAIKLGGPSSDSSTRLSRAQPATTLGKRPRQHHALNGDSESDSEDPEDGRHERITAFGANGSEFDTGNRPHRRKPSKVLVIERQGNRDWRTEAKARRRAQREAVEPRHGTSNEITAPEEKTPLHWGLTVKERTSDASFSQAREEAAGPQTGERLDEHSVRGEDTGKSIEDPDREAVDALLGRSKEPLRRDLVIERNRDAITEDSVFHRDFRDAPDESTLDDYEAMPVEEFGAALLRGMGWDGKPRGPKPKEVKRRANQLGLGAKELKGNEDLGAWNQKGGQKSRPRLNDYKRDEEKRRERRDERYHDSYKRERERERASERDRDRDRGERYRHRDRHH